jgi:choline kinase
MQYIILCAGKGTRMGNLTKNKPKCLIEYRGKTLLDYKIEILNNKKVSEIILVIGYLGEQVVQYVTIKWPNIKFVFVYDEKMTGTADSLMLCKKYIKNKFMVLMGDDIYDSRDFERIEKLEKAILVKKQKTNVVSGLICDEKLFLKDFSDKSFLENTGLYLLDKKYFNLKIGKTKSGESGIPHTLVLNTGKYKISILETGNWQKMNLESDLLS